MKQLGQDCSLPGKLSIVSVLDEISALPPSERRSRIGDPDMHAALVAVGTEDGIRWLEDNIDSPIGPVWSWLLVDLSPRWEHLERWIRRSKLHGLAAIDTLLTFAAAELGQENDEPQLPDGADSKSINEALDFALASYGNPRIKDAVKRLRHVWPVGPRPTHDVEVPTALMEVAKILFRDRPRSIGEWQNAMTAAIEPPEEPAEIYDSLLEFAATRDALAIVDWREDADEVVASLRSLQPARELAIRWDDHARSEEELVPLLQVINADAGGHDDVLLALDRGSDDYPLTFVPSMLVPRLEAWITSFDDPTMSVVRFP